MTTARQKESERRTLEHLLQVLDLRSDGEPVGGEKPDFIVLVSGRSIGVEITAFQSGTTTDDGVDLRKIEGEWQRFEAASVQFRQARPHLQDLNAGLFFKASLPPRRDYAAFMEEIAAFALKHSARLAPRGCGRSLTNMFVFDRRRACKVRRSRFYV
jgi:hypothetical protein